MPPPRRRPDGYAIIAAFLAMGTVATVTALAGSDEVLFRAQALLCSAVFAITTEALWACRPWCVRAAAAVPVAWIAGMGLEVVSEGGLRFDLGLWMVASAAGGWVTVAYVRNRARRLFAAVP